MKKILLLLTAAFAVNAFGEISEPRLMFGEALSGISPDGNWVAGQIADGSVIIRNLATDERWIHLSDGGNKNYYVGHGLPVSNIGVVVGATNTYNAAYWENGRWKELPTPHPGWIRNAVSITADGGIICGGIGGAEMADDTESTMLLPALWYRQEDGSYSDPVMLPHPKEDLTGRPPQYITTFTMSADGKTVGGQLMDYYGGVCEPIVYRCDENGEWSYTLLGRDLLNPKNIEFPEWPGSLPDDILMPTQEWFMTQEQIDAFVNAFNDWNNIGEPPRYEDFMTEEQIEAYRKAMQEYLDIALPWSEKYEAFMALYRNYVRSGVSFGFNNGRISPDGRYFVMTASGLNNVGSYGGGSMPVVFDLITGEYTILRSDHSININYISEDYTLLGFTGAAKDVGTRKAYVYPQMQPGGIALEDYMKQINPDIYDWMEDHLLQDIIIGLGSETLYETELMFSTGIPTATPDLKYILTNNITWSWLDDPGEDYVSVLIPTQGTSKVNEVALEIDAVEYEVYDLNGRKVMTTRSKDETASLDKGIYLIKEKDKTGNWKTYKIAK